MTVLTPFLQQRPGCREGIASFRRSTAKEVLTSSSSGVHDLSAIPTYTSWVCAVLTTPHAADKREAASLGISTPRGEARQAPAGWALNVWTPRAREDGRALRHAGCLWGLCLLEDGDRAPGLWEQCHRWRAKDQCDGAPEALHLSQSSSR